MHRDAPNQTGSDLSSDPCDRSVVGVGLRSLVTLAMAVTVSLGALDAAARAAAVRHEPAGLRAWPGVLLRVVVGGLIRADECEADAAASGWGRSGLVRRAPVQRDVVDQLGRRLARLGLVDLPPPALA